MLLFVKNCQRDPLHGGRLHCQVSGFLPYLVFILAFQIAVMLGAGSARRHYNGTVQICSTVKFVSKSAVSKYKLGSDVSDD